MKCDKCYFENPDDQTHCINCGNKLPKPPKKENKKPTITYIKIKPSPINNIQNHKEDDYYNVHFKQPEDTNQSNKIQIIYWVIMAIFFVVIVLVNYGK